MDRCLQIPEILRLICHQIPGDAPTRGRWLLVTALSCRAFLEPALDNLWYRVDNLKPIIACLPKDLLKSETKRHHTRRSDPYTFTVLSLKRVITSADLERYLTYYAPRIRMVNILPLKEIFSVDVWQGLQLVTHFKTGALAPFNADLSWCLSEYQCWSITPDLLTQAYPYFSLFLGQMTTSLTFGVTATIPIHLASVESAVSGPANIKRLHIFDVRAPTSTSPYIGRGLSPQSWVYLEDLNISTVPHDCLPALASLPRLSHLAIIGLLDVQALNYCDDDNGARDRLASLSDATAFPALQRLVLSSGKYEHFSGVLQLIHPINRLSSLKCILTDASNPDPTGEIENLVRTIQYHCNHDTLKKLVIRELIDPMDLEDDEELDDDDARFQLIPFLPFHKLETVCLDMRQQVLPGPRDIENIISSWPNLVKLKIDVNLPSSQIPAIDATDFLNLVYNCRHLEKLGLRINASGIRHAEPRPGSARYDIPAPLTKIWVGDSPIVSPSKVSNLLSTHCPKLLTGHVYYIGEEDVGTETSWFRAIYSRRWEVVDTSLGYS